MNKGDLGTGAFCLLYLDTDSSLPSEDFQLIVIKKKLDFFFCFFLPPSSLLISVLLCSVFRDNFLVLDIFFEALNYETIEQKKAYDVAGLLGEI